MALNTKIRGAQISNNEIDENHLKVSVAGDGLSGGAGSALAVDFDELSEIVLTQRQILWQL